jgi:flagellar protein FlaG
MDAVQNRIQVSPVNDTTKSASSTFAPAQTSASSLGTSTLGVAPGGGTSRPVNPTEKASLDSVGAELQDSVEAANDRLAVYNQKLDIAIDGATGAIVVKVSDADTGETLRQIPSEDALRIMRNIDSLTGILVDHKE